MKEDNIKIYLDLLFNFFLKQETDFYLKPSALLFFQFFLSNRLSPLFFQKSWGFLPLKKQFFYLKSRKYTFRVKNVEFHFYFFRGFALQIKNFLFFKRFFFVRKKLVIIPDNQPYSSSVCPSAAVQAGHAAPGPFFAPPGNFTG